MSGVEFEEAPSSRGGIPRQARDSRAPERERIAITGMSIVNSLGNSPEEVWAASEMMKSGIVHVPPSKWDHRIFYDPRPRVPEKTYCQVGAFQNIEVSRKELGIPPQDFRTMTDSTPDYHVARAAGYRRIGNSRIGKCQRARGGAHFSEFRRGCRHVTGCHYSGVSERRAYFLRVKNAWSSSRPKRSRPSRMRSNRGD